MRKWIAGSLCALLLCGVFTACGEQEQSSTVVENESSSRRPDNLPEESEERPESLESSREEAPEDEPVDEPGRKQITVFLYRPEENNYFPSSEPIDDDSVSAILDVVIHVLGLPTAYDTNIEQIKGQVILDFEGGYIDTCLSDEEVETIFLNSLCATIVYNHPAAEWIDLRRDGSGYRSANRTLEPEQPYEWPELAIGGGTAAEYTDIRAGVPYDGMRAQVVDFLRYDIVPTDDTGKELTRYLARVGDPGGPVDSPADLDNAFVLERALENVMWYTTVDYGQPETYHPELLSIATAVKDDTVALREHVELVARELFGDIPFENAEFSPWKWHPTEGVYTPPHMGGGTYTQPVILSYTEVDGGYRVELVYLRDAMGAFIDESGTIIPEAELQTVAQTRMRRREVVVSRTGDGEMILQSHRYL